MLPPKARCWCPPPTDVEPTLPFADPRICFLFRFGNDSFKPHLAAAKATGKTLHRAATARASRLMSTIQRTCSNFSRIPAKPTRKRLLRRWGLDRSPATGTEGL